MSHSTENFRHPDSGRKCQCEASTVPEPEKQGQPVPLEEGLRRGENLGRAQRATRRRQCPLSLAGPPLPLTGRQQGGRQASLPEEDRLTPWLGALFPKIPPCSPPTASLLRHQPWDLAGSRVLGTGLGVARAVRGPESWEASSPLAEAGPKR